MGEQSASSFANIVLIFGILQCVNHHPVAAVVIKWANYPNERPIIGVLSQEMYDEVNKSYIAASYVKFVEAGGARVVPFRIGRPAVTYEATLDSINGALFPGGSVSVTNSHYATIGKYIYDYAIQANDRGEYFPIWATCLGFEMLATLLVPGHDIITNCSAYDMALPLNFTENATEGRLFGDLPEDVYQALINKNVTGNYHHKCLTPEKVKESGLDQIINVLSTNFDANGVEFVSTFEVKKYPFFAVQWHPEKAPWEWNTDEVNIPHSPDAIRVTQYFSGFLANQARQSLHKYDDPAREQSELIYNNSPYYSGKNGSDFEQIYKIKFG